MFMKKEIAKKYGKESEQYGFFCWAFARRDSDYIRDLYEKLMNK